MDKILITYATKTGSTSEIAKFIGDVLQDDGFAVDVSEIGEVVDLSSYQTVVVGSATRMDKVLNEAVKFMLQHQKEFQHKTTAYFLVGVIMKEDTLENLKTLAKSPDVLAWGETGLDFNRMYSPKEICPLFKRYCLSTSQISSTFL